MAWLIFNKGRNKVFMTSKQRGQIIKMLYDQLGLSIVDRASRMISTDPNSRKEKKQNQEEFDFMEDYILHKATSDELAALFNLRFYGKQAQEIVYELLSDFCALHHDFSLKIIDNNPFSIAAIEGNMMLDDHACLIHTNTKGKGFKRKKYESMSLPIPKKDVEAIEGTFENFTISFSDGHKISFIDIKDGDKVSLYATVTVYK